MGTQIVMDGTSGLTKKELRKLIIGQSILINTPTSEGRVLATVVSVDVDKNILVCSIPSDGSSQDNDNDQTVWDDIFEEEHKQGYSTRD